MASVEPEKAKDTTEKEKVKVNLKDPEATSFAIPAVFTVVPLCLGYGIASAIYNFGAHSTYSKKLDAVGDGRWGYAAAVVLGRTIVLLNMMPLKYKNGWAALDAGNARANPFIFKSTDGKHVLLEDEGTIGKYNRTNRSVHHMIETYGCLVAGLYMSSQVFPLPTFVLTCLYCVGRLAHSVGYAKGYGGHAPGFMLQTLALSTVEGLLAFVAINA